tara:strand:+ start:229 stop:636 length:408 start_codon:yes stop_codon:yes gene_type:complete
MKNIRLTRPLEDRYQIDLTRPVRLYRNLREKCWSIQQDGLVKAHCKRAWLSDCQFHVNENGRQRVLKQRKKYVHAYIIGNLFGWPIDSRDWPKRKVITYNPFKYSSFVTLDGEPVKRAKYVKADINAINHITASA